MFHILPSQLYYSFENRQGCLQCTLMYASQRLAPGNASLQCTEFYSRSGATCVRRATQTCKLCTSTAEEVLYIHAARLATLQGHNQYSRLAAAFSLVSDCKIAPTEDHLSCGTHQQRQNLHSPTGCVLCLAPSERKLPWVLSKPCCRAVKISSLKDFKVSRSHSTILTA